MCDEENCRSDFSYCYDKGKVHFGFLFGGEIMQQSCRWLVTSHPCQKIERDECRYSFHWPPLKKSSPSFYVCMDDVCACVTAKGQPCRLSTFMWILGIKLRSEGLSDKCYPTKLSHPLCLPEVLKITSIFCGEKYLSRTEDSL